MTIKAQLELNTLLFIRIVTTYAGLGDISVSIGLHFTPIVHNYR